MNEPSILIIDDEPAIRKLLEITLESNNYKVFMAANAREGKTMAANYPNDLIVLDIGLPDISGHQLLKELREWYTKPIIILSVQNGEKDIIQALDNGANDYLVKPFRSGEFLARVRSCLRNTLPTEEKQTIQIGEFTLDLTERRLRLEDETIKLTATEYSLLSVLAINEGKVLTHSYLLQQVWGPGYIDETQYLRVFVAQLRKKIEQDPNQPKHIITESGIGYRLVS